MKKSHILQLDAAYKKSFNRINKNKDFELTTGLCLFVEYLKYSRDSILTRTANNVQKHDFVKAKLASLIAAIAEFEAYININTPMQQQTFHWNNFCELVRLNMEEWLRLNDSI